MSWKFRFYRRIPLIPGLLTLNLGERGWSVTVGPRGLRFTFGPGGRQVSVGIPGTGARWQRRLK